MKAEGGEQEERSRGAEMLCLVTDDVIQPQPGNDVLCEKSGK